MKRIHIISLSVILLLFIFAAVWKNSNLFRNSGHTEVAGQQFDKESTAIFWDQFNRADKHRMDGNFRQAADFYKIALDINEEHEGTLYNLGNVHLFLNEFNEAEQYWQRLVKINPSSARAWLQLGTLYFCRVEGNSLYSPQSAREKFLKASELNREETGPRLHLAKIAILNNNYSKAEEYLDSVIAQNFMSYRARFLKGYIQWKSGETEKSRAHISEAGTLYANLHQVTMQGEGATASGFNPMLSDAMFCDFIGNRIDLLLDEHKKTGFEKIIRQFDEAVGQWKNKISAAN